MIYIVDVDSSALTLTIWARQASVKYFEIIEQHLIFNISQSEK